jgi:hypothetical protein
VQASGTAEASAVLSVHDYMITGGLVTVVAQIETITFGYLLLNFLAWQQKTKKEADRQTHSFYFLRSVFRSAYTSNYHMPVAGSTFRFRGIKIGIKIGSLMFMSNYRFW